MIEPEVQALLRRIDELEEANTRLELQLAEARDRLADEDEALERRNAELRVSYLGTIQAISRAIEAKDPFTQGHSALVTKYSLALAREVGYPWDRIERVQIAAMLLDVGKIGIPREILTKRGALTDEEQRILRTHVEIGAKILEPVVYPWDVSTLVYQHHERMDGSGYPRGLRGDQIVFEARILGLVDSFCAMITDRAYRGAFSRPEAVAHIQASAGRLWDPAIAEAFLRLLSRDEEEIFRDLAELIGTAEG